MNKEKIKNMFDDVGRKANYVIDDFAAFHNFEKWQVWLAIAIVIVLIVLMITFI
ncbi:hypothetical protein SOV_51870 [Sporomusa ovata DSM 2662]|uniref:Uncharacterized protein n=1 Tax=Sporomusa ovata TaxID=2378 RepID=A0A0U1L149_9FIRM|nr:hypothetical protein [Sporomusa ovata]EQB27559.1 hypothetical protein SOV_2c04560 [Sporomusa ovata DSM 2662]CQR73407.1 hypothetical protein SpAn4DRAFT_2639 [Sporomusa ovata]